MLDLSSFFIPLFISISIFSTNILIFKTFMVPKKNDINIIVIHGFLTFIFFLLIYRNTKYFSKNIIYMIAFTTIGSYFLYIIISFIMSLIKNKKFDNYTFVTGMYFIFSNIIGMIFTMSILTVYIIFKEEYKNNMRYYVDPRTRRFRYKIKGTLDVRKKPKYKLDSSVKLTTSDTEFKDT